MCDHGLLNNLIMHVEQVQRAGFIGPHLTAKANDVGEHDRGELASLSLRDPVFFCAHGGDYGLSFPRLSNSPPGQYLVARVKTSLLCPEGAADGSRG